MRAGAPYLIGVATLGLAFIALTGPSEETGGGVVLNRAPPRTPSWGLNWEAWQRPERRPFAAPVAAPAAEDAAAGQGWKDAAYAGVWATPAEFSDSD